MPSVVPTEMLSMPTRLRYSFTCKSRSKSSFRLNATNEQKVSYSGRCVSLSLLGNLSYCSTYPHLSGQEKKPYCFLPYSFKHLARYFMAFFIAESLDGWTKNATCISIAPTAGAVFATTKMQWETIIPHCIVFSLYSSIEL